MSSPEPVVPPLLTPSQRNTLLTTARASIRHGLDSGSALEVELEEFEQPLREQRACFVTLHRNRNLRGCIGHLEAVQPLIRDVAENAFAAAFKDPRFAPLKEDEMEGLDIHISILTLPRPLPFSTEQDLLSRLRPGIDGLILEDGAHRGTFLPSVWESLPDPESFLQHLKIKAGLPQNYWSDTVTVYRYETESFPA
jgi:AmmeMemoRadiSam system protein A